MIRPTTVPDTKSLDSGILEAVVAVFPTHETAEQAVRDVQRAGFDMKKLSIIGKDYQTEQDVVGYYSTGGRMKAWGKQGAFWGGLWGMLFGSAFFIIPGVGPLLVAGPILTWLIAALEGAAVVGGISALGAALVSVGIPKNRIIEYETQVKAGHFVVIAHGTVRELGAIRDTLGTGSDQFTPALEAVGAE
ncbi:general stress protein [Gemmatimonas sp.]|uniref:general stress protein n=1 Tax=Gemmatimonas sp. TaxID=1962908 RepID=UPI0033409CDA